jgi:hypothetical protein
METTMFLSLPGLAILDVALAGTAKSFAFS